MIGQEGIATWADGTSQNLVLLGPYGSNITWRSK